MLLLLSCVNNSPPAPSPEPRVQYPRPSVDGVPGWLGFAVSTKKNSYEEAPVIPHAAYAIPQGSAWKDVPAGTGLLAIHPGGQTALTFAGIGPQPLGCDGMQQDLATFDGGSMRPGPIWLLPPSSTDAQVLHIASSAPTSEKRSWIVDGEVLALVKTGTYTADLKLGETVLKSINTAEVMDGAEAEEIDLTGFTIYADEVVGAWSLPDAGRVALTRWPSFEGAHYDLVFLDRAALHGDAESVYLCAF